MRLLLLLPLLFASCSRAVDAPVEDLAKLCEGGQIAALLQVPATLAGLALLFWSTSLVKIIKKGGQD